MLPFVQTAEFANWSGTGSFLGAIISIVIRSYQRSRSYSSYMQESATSVIFTDLTLEKNSLIGLCSFIYALIHGVCVGGMVASIIYTFVEKVVEVPLPMIGGAILAQFGFLVLARVTIESYVIFLRTAENASHYFKENSPRSEY